MRALRSAVRDDRVSHAYLFSGPRGTGKTSSARILAKALNCEAPVDGEPCGVCTSCVEITQGSSLNVHELDAASNNGVDAMRDLVAHAGLGTPGRWKVYIVDEVHMLSTAAANALLKTLEEPPSHVVFVLATTDPQKVPPTIRSRTQHLEFRLLGAETLHDLLESVNEEAGLQVDEEALEAAVRRGPGLGPRRPLRAGPGRRRRARPTPPGPSSPQVIDALADGDVSQVLVALERAAGRRLGPPAAGDRADRRPAPGLPRRAGARAVRGVGTVARSASVPLPRRWGWPAWCAAWRSWATRWSTSARRPTRRWSWRSPPSAPCGPDLDSGMEALSERVSVLERALSGAPAFPRPGAAAERRRPCPDLRVRRTGTARAGTASRRAAG